jgi:DNA invertase Pin-like site-specific DNA recombinase
MTTFDMNNAVDNAFGMDVYAIYLRKSRADVEAEKLGEGETLARHRKILTELAARKGLYIGKIYEEIVSGETIEARPEIQKLIEDCYKGKYRGILIVEVTRLSRGNQGDAQKILDCLKYSNRNNGVLVITPTKTYDVAHSQEDEEYMEFELFMSRREYKMIQKRMDRGRKQAVVEGNFMGSYRPYGYDILKTKTGRTLIPNEDEAPIVKMIYEWTVNDNLSPFKIAERLTNMGVPTYYGEKDWSKETVKTILTNQTYMGKVRWNDRMTVKTMVDGELKATRPRSNHSDHFMLYDGKHMKHALVDEETFKAASSRFHNDRTRSNLKLVNPLAGLLFCKKCGKSMGYQSYRHKKNGPMDRYNHRQSANGCKVKSAVAEDVIKAVIHALKLYIEDFEFKLDNTPDVDENSINTQLEALQKEIRKSERKLAKLFDSWEDEKITDNEFVQRKAVHNQKIENIKRQMEELEYSIPEREEYEDKIILLSEALVAITDESLDADIKNEYLKRIIDRIEFSRENNSEFILDIDLC